VVVIHVEPGSPAAEAGIHRGDVILEVERKAVKDVDDFSQKITKAGDQESILMLIQRGQNSLYASVTPK
jgi:S1-C subfamily serine protease